MSVYLLTNLGNLLIIGVLWSSYFIKKTWIKVAIATGIAILIKFRPGFDFYNIAFFISLVIGMIVEDYLPFTKRAGLIFSMALSLIIFNLLLYLF